MSQLAKVTKGMLCFGDSRRRRTGLIFLEDGKTPCNDVYCEEGMVVKVSGFKSFNWYQYLYNYNVRVYTHITGLSNFAYITLLCCRI